MQEPTLASLQSELDTLRALLDVCSWCKEGLLKNYNCSGKRCQKCGYTIDIDRDKMHSSQSPVVWKVVHAPIRRETIAQPALLGLAVAQPASPPGRGRVATEQSSPSRGFVPQPALLSLAIAQPSRKSQTPATLIETVDAILRTVEEASYMFESVLRNFRTRSTQWNGFSSTDIAKELQRRGFKTIADMNYLRVIC